MLYLQRMSRSQRRFAAFDGHLFEGHLLEGHLGGCVSRAAHDSRMVFQTHPEMRAREPDGETAVTGVYRLHRRSAVAGKVRVMMS